MLCVVAVRAILVQLVCADAIAAAALRVRCRCVCTVLRVAAVAAATITTARTAPIMARYVSQH